MGQERSPRISGCLPRGGLGFVGVIVSAAGIACSLWAGVLMVIPLAIGCLLLCVWCAIGLRRDDDAGAVADRYATTGRRGVVFWMNLLSGQFESERRYSTDMIVVSVVALVIALIRYFIG